MKKLLTAITALIPFTLFSQTVEEDFHSPQVLSPDVTGMMRNDNLNSVNLFTGSVNHSIPIIDFQDPDFNFPIGISYGAMGFQPRDVGSNVGLHWSLSVGGVIQREVKGIPDEINTYTLENKNIRGFLTGAHGLRKENMADMMANPENYFYVKDDIGDLSNDYFVKAIGTNVEISSDIYNFSFGEHSGKFMIGFDGQPIVSSPSGRKYIVDISGHTASSMNHSAGTHSSVIKITADDGFTYHFGGSYNAMEYTALGWQWPGPDEGFQKGLVTRKNQVNAFHLFKIVAPNGRELTISYDSRIPAEYHKNPEYLLSRYETISSIRNNEYYLNYSMGLSWTTRPGSTRGPAIKSYSLNKVALIKSIYTDDKKVEFYFSKRDQLLFPEENMFRFASHCGAKLDSVVLYKDEAGRYVRVESTKFNYNHHRRMMLDNIVNSKQGKYSFGYNLISDPAADYFTTNLDFWNFWRGTPENKNLFPYGLSLGEAYDAGYEGGDPQGPVIITTDDREPMGNQYDMSLLNTIIFPTGGYIAYKYEPHACEYYYEHSEKSWTLATNRKYPEPMTVGGARVKQAIYYDEDGNIAKDLAYTYSSSFSGSGSSGTVLYKPKMAFKRFIPVPDYNNVSFFISYSENGFKNIKTPYPHICYQTVNEYMSPAAYITSKADSTYTAGVFSLDERRSRTVLITVADQIGDKKIVSTNWNIKGSYYPRTGAKAYLTIKNGTWVLKEYKLENSSIDINIDPMKEFGPGKYIVEIQAEDMAYVYLKSIYKFQYNPDRIEGPAVRRVDFRVVSDKHSPDKYFNAYKHPIYDAQHKEFDLIRLSRYPCDMVDYSDRRGMMLSESFYDAELNEIRREEYNYPSLYESQNSTFYGFCMPAELDLRFHSYTFLHKIDFFPVHPTGKTITEKDDNGNIMITTETYGYNDNNYLSTVTTVDSKNQTVKLASIYPFEKDGEIYRKMEELNKIGTPVEQYTTLEKSGTEHELQRTVVDYVVKENSRGQSVMVLPSLISSSTGGAPSIEKARVERHDRYGNPVHTIKDETLSSVYIWGYGGKYLIASIENADYASVYNALGITPEQISQQEIPDMVLVNNLREILANALVSTYTYNPLVGMTSQTDPSGRTTFYDYDSSNRLTEIYTFEKNQRLSLKKIEYNILHK